MSQLSDLTLGVRGLLGSKKAIFSLLIFIAVVVAVFTGKISGSEFVAALTVTSTIYCASTAAVDMKNGGGISND